MNLLQRIEGPKHDSVEEFEIAPYHEAAHAVVALALGLDVTLLSLDGSGLVVEGARLEGSRCEVGPSTPEQAARVAVAGPALDSLCGALAPFSCAGDKVKFFSLGLDRAARDRAIEDCHGLVLQHLDRIQRVGDALATRRTLGRREIRALYGLE